MSILRTLLEAGISIKLEYLNAQIDAKQYNKSNGTDGYYLLKSIDKHRKVHKIPFVFKRKNSTLANILNTISHAEKAIISALLCYLFYSVIN